MNTYQHNNNVKKINSKIHTHVKTVIQLKYVEKKKQLMNN